MQFPLNPDNVSARLENLNASNKPNTMSPGLIKPIMLVPTVDVSSELSCPDTSQLVGWHGLSVCLAKLLHPQHIHPSP